MCRPFSASVSRLSISLSRRSFVTYLVIVTRGRPAVERDRRGSLEVARGHAGPLRVEQHLEVVRARGKRDADDDDAGVGRVDGTRRLRRVVGLAVCAALRDGDAACRAEDLNLEGLVADREGGRLAA